MMIPVYVGTKRHLEKDCWTGRVICPACGQIADQFLGRVTESNSVMFIPIGSQVKQRVAFCSSCSHGIELTKKQYNELLKAQLESPDMPPEEVLISDYSPKATKTSAKITGVIIMLLILLLLIWGAVKYYNAEMSKNADALAALIVTAFLFLLPMILFLIATIRRIKALRFCLQKNKLYRSANVHQR